jgi:hypothetical protein
MSNSSLIYKYVQLNNRMSFKEAEKQCKNFANHPYHLGQLKLLMSEILFLTKFAKDKNKVVYVGAAEGYHISYLADMFPTLLFELWDATPFKLEIKKNIKLFKRYFEETDAIQYSKEGNNILFISDIRNVEIGFTKLFIETDNSYDKMIEDDNSKQYKWVNTIKPIAAYLKFRPAYSPGITTYFNGKIYLQPYSPLSTETRLLVTNYDDMIDYDNIEFDEKLAYFNCKDRINVFDSKWKNIMIKNKIVYIWDNIYAFNILSKYMKKHKSIISDDGVLLVFNDIIQFLKKKYGKKYSVIYNK